MNKFQEQVEEFHEAIKATIGKTVDFRDVELRKKLITEEYEEFIEAVDNRDMVETVDAMCDLIYVICGAATTFGIDLELFYDEVHRSNMEKTKGPKREDGKQLKPEGWQPPQIKAILDVYTYSKSLSKFALKSSIYKILAKVPDIKEDYGEFISDAPFTKSLSASDVFFLKMHGEFIEHPEDTYDFLKEEVVSGKGLPTHQFKYYLYI